MKQHLHPSSNIKGLIFDLDGTLADTMPMHIDAWIKAGEHYGVHITSKMIVDRAGTPTIEVVQQLNQAFNWSLNPLAFRKVKTEVYLKLKKARGKIQPIREVVDIASTYKGVLPMAIGTGSIRSNATIAIQELAIGDWFKGVITAEDVIHPKPHPETFLKCASIIGIDPKNCLVYEDGIMGIEAALAGGMTAVNIQTLELFEP